MFCHHRRRAMIDEQAWDKRPEGEHGLFAGRCAGVYRATARASDGMEIHRVIHYAAGIVLEMNFNGITDAHAEEWAWDLSIECPIGEGRAIRELTDDFHCFEVNAHVGRAAAANRAGQVGRVARDVSPCSWRACCRGWG